MITTITDLKKIANFRDNSYYYVIYFNYFDKKAFTYLTQESILYWKRRGLNELKRGMQINVFFLHDIKRYKIVAFFNPEGVAL